MATVSLLGSTFDTTAGSKQVVATPAVDDLIVIIAGASGANQDDAETTSVSDGSGGTYVKVEDSSDSGVGLSPRVSIWIRESKISAATSHTFAAIQAASTGGGLVVLAVAGVSKTGSSAARKTATAYDTASSQPTAFFSSGPSAASPVIGALINFSNPAGVTAPFDSWTEAADVGYLTPDTGLEVAHKVGHTAAMVQWGTSATNWRVVILEVDPSNLGGTAGLDFGAGSSTLTASGARGFLKRLRSLMPYIWLERLTPDFIAIPGAISGTAALSFSNTAAVAGPSYISGTCALAFGGTPTIRGNTALNGNGGLVFQYSVTPTLGAIKPAAGTAAIEFGGTPVIRNTGAKGGARRIDEWKFSNVYDLAVYRRLTPKTVDALTRSAVVALTLDATGVLTATGALAGTCAITITPTATATASGALAGSADIAFTPELYSGNSLISGTAALTFANTASIGGAMVGTCALAFGEGSSTLRGTVSAQGSVELTFNANGAPLNGVYQNGVGQPLFGKGWRFYGQYAAVYLNPPVFRATGLAGSCALTFANAGALTGPAYLTGTIALTLDGLAYAGGALGASSAITFSGYGGISASGRLAGTCAIAFGNSAFVPTITQVTGTCALTFTTAGRCRDINTPDYNTVTSLRGDAEGHAFITHSSRGIGTRSGGKIRAGGGRRFRA